MKKITTRNGAFILTIKLTDFVVLKDPMPHDFTVDEIYSYLKERSREECEAMRNIYSYHYNDNFGLCDEVGYIYPICKDRLPGNHRVVLMCLDTLSRRLNASFIPELSDKISVFGAPMINHENEVEEEEDIDLELDKVSAHISIMLEEAKGMRVDETDIVYKESKFYDDPAYVKHYISSTYANRALDVASVLLSIPYEEKVLCAPGDGIGVVANMGSLMGFDVHAGDLSIYMCEFGIKLNQAEVSNEQWKRTIKYPGVIVVVFMIRVCPMILHYIATKYPKRKVLVIDDTEYFVGREYFIPAVIGRNGVYVRNFKLRRPRYRLSFETRFKRSVWTDFYRSNDIYAIADDSGANLIQTHMYWGSNPKTCSLEKKYESVGRNQPYTRESIMLFEKILYGGHYRYYDVKRGRLIYYLTYDNANIPKWTEPFFVRGHIVSGARKGTRKVWIDGEIWYYCHANGYINISMSDRFQKVNFTIKN